jgi:nitrite reductase/ring-hydroxylating ferredoxin subunit
MPFVTTTEAGVPSRGRPPRCSTTTGTRRCALTARLRPGKLATAMLLDIPLVLGRRSDGRVFAMRDSCPHRGIPLSYGWFDGNHVTCSYHGWEFEPCSGQCALIPSLSSHDHLDATRIFATAFPCEERDGHAWVYIPARNGKRESAERAAQGCAGAGKFGRATAPRSSPPTCPATWITASSA